MNKQDLIELLSKESFTLEDQKLVSDMKEQFPWFGLARFLDLKMDYQRDKELNQQKVSKAVVFSGDRKFLYNWIRDEVKKDSLLQHVTHELEFIDDSDVSDSDTLNNNIIKEGIDIPDTVHEDVHDGVQETVSESDTLRNNIIQEGVEIPDAVHEDVHDAVQETVSESDTLQEDAIIAEAPCIDDVIHIPLEDTLPDVEQETAADEIHDESVSSEEGVYDSDQDLQVVVEKEDNDLDHPEFDEAMSVPFIDSLEDEEEEKSVPTEGRVVEMSLEQQAVETEETETPSGSDSVEILQELVPVPEYIADIDAILMDSLNKNKDEESPKPVNLIEQFLKNEPSPIKGEAETSLKGDISEKSVKEDDAYITDTLAKIYVKQGLHAKAIYAYERLSLKYPEKSAYFAAQIEKIKSISNF